MHVSSPRFGSLYKVTATPNDKAVFEKYDSLCLGVKQRGHEYKSEPPDTTVYWGGGRRFWSVPGLLGAARMSGHAAYVACSDTKDDLVKGWIDELTKADAGYTFTIDRKPDVSIPEGSPVELHKGPLHDYIDSDSGHAI